MTRMTSQFPSRIGWGFAAAALIVLTACSAVTSQPVPGAPANTEVVIMSGFRPAAIPPDPRTASLSAFETAASLRRIVVRYIKYSAMFKTDPQPLLSDAQTDQFGQILARELPALKENQRLRFSFTDRYFGRGYAVEMDVYREGRDLVYWFNALATNFASPTMAGGQALFLGVLQKAADGQEVANLDSYAYVKDPVLSEDREAASTLADKTKLLDQADKDGVVEKGERASLEALIAKPKPSTDVWASYWDKRRTLKKAFDQNLMDRASYQIQLDKLNAELTR